MHPIANSIAFWLLINALIVVLAWRPR